MNKTCMRLWLGATLATAAAAASAHTGHGTASLVAGLAHPFALDHLLAMVAVGVWSAAALPAGRRWAGPALFMALLGAGAVAGSAGLALPLLESAIAVSVALLGALLIAPRALPLPLALATIAAAAALNGLAHGAELPAGGLFAGYVAGLLATTALLHAAGLMLGRRMLGLHAIVWRAAGAALGVAGWLLLLQP